MELSRIWGNTSFFNWLIVEILDTLLPNCVHRIHPRIVKKPVSNFRSEKPQQARKWLITFISSHFSYAESVTADDL
jgi:hypothetical protein